MSESMQSEETAAPKRGRKKANQVTEAPATEKKTVKKAAPATEKKTAKKAAPATEKKAARNPGVAAALSESRIVADIMKAASDPSRLFVLNTIAANEGTYSVNQISEDLATSQPAVSHHLAILRHSGIVTANRDGKNNFYQLTELGQALLEAVNLVKNHMEAQKQ